MAGVPVARATAATTEATLSSGRTSTSNLACRVAELQSRTATLFRASTPPGLLPDVEPDFGGEVGDFGDGGFAGDGADDDAEGPEEEEEGFGTFAAAVADATAAAFGFGFNFGMGDGDRDRDREGDGDRDREGEGDGDGDAIVGLVFFVGLLLFRFASVSAGRGGTIAFASLLRQQ